MPSIQIYIGQNEDIPEKFHEQYFALRQQCEEEWNGFLAPSLDYYRNFWIIPREKGSAKMKAIAVNENNLVIGFGVIFWNTMYENLDRSWFRLYVIPKERRKGVGSRILKEMVKVLPKEIKKVGADSPKHSPGEHFLQKFNEKHSYEEVIIIVDLEEAVLKDVEKEAKKQREHALSNGYRIVRVDDGDYKSHFDEEGFVKIVEQVWNDMPREDLTEEDMNITVERYQAIQERNKKTGQKYISFVAVHEETEKPVGYTTFAINKYQPAIAWQDETGIIPEHRGNGLGLAIKYLSLLTLLKETKAKYWRTSSAQSNKYMHRINEILGHKIWQSEPVYEFERKIVEELLSE